MELTHELQNNLALHPMQTWEWGEARSQMGVRVEKMVVNDSIFQMTIHSVPYTSYSIGYLPRSVVPTATTLRQLYQFGKKNKLIFIKLEPYVDYAAHIDTSIDGAKVIPSAHPLFPEWTQTLDLTPPEDLLMKNLKSKTRYNIRLAEKKGVTISEMNTDEGFAIFSQLYFETCRRQHYHGHTPEYHRVLWNALKSSQAKILIAFYNKQPLAAYELLHFKNTLYYIYGGSSVENKQVMAPNLLMWESIKLGKRLGATTFDMWGSLEPGYAETHPWAGFTRFKEGYNTQFTHLMQSHDLVIDNTLYALYGIVHSVRDRFL
jgi:lipid II:glycine glycyltransferase (peptidoglycan interpeptide bridge formation enzyme)